MCVCVCKGGGGHLLQPSRRCLRRSDVDNEGFTPSQCGVARTNAEQLTIVPYDYHKLTAHTWSRRVPSFSNMGCGSKNRKHILHGSAFLHRLMFLRAIQLTGQLLHHLVAHFRQGIVNDSKLDIVECEGALSMTYGMVTCHRDSTRPAITRKLCMCEPPPILGEWGQ